MVKYSDLENIIAFQKNCAKKGFHY